MRQPKLTRRQLFKASALGAGALTLPALGLASVAAAPSREAQAAAEQPDGPAIPQPTFNPIASNTTFGPLTDISMGWDGTLWGIDAQGAPHVYDEINKVWAPHGDGIDAATMSGDATTIYVFQGPNVVPVNAATLTAGAPTTIAALWPTLPDSFKLGVNGAMTSRDGNGLILFNGGRYVATDGTIPPGRLADLPGWPTTGVWVNSVTVNGVTKTDGIIDAAYNAFGETVQVLQRAGQVLMIRLMRSEMQVMGAPISFSAFVNNFFGSLPADWMSSGGVDAMTATPSEPKNPIVFKGTSALVFTGQSATPKYIGTAISNWPATWHPVLAHAPSGRDGNLWCATAAAQNSVVVQHNGEAWTQHPFQANHVGVGQDNAVMLAAGGYLFAYDPNRSGSGFYSVTPPSSLIQVSLGNANAVNARDGNGNVFNFVFNADRSSGTLTQNTDVSANGGATHIATTSDGSLWHAKPNDPNMHRQLLGSGAAPQAIPVKDGLTATVNRVAGVGFGAAHCLATDTQGNTQAYRYDSPYVFKTAAQYNVNNAAGTAIYVEQGAGLLFLLDGRVISDNPYVFESQVVAIDAHTGVEVARRPQLPNAALNYGQPVFDPVNNLVYVAIATSSSFTDTSTPGQVLALDARTLAVTWSFTTKASVDATPLLIGTRLFVSDRTGEIYMFDTAAALANPSNVQPKWAVNVASAAGAVVLISQPVYVPVTDPQYKSDLIYFSTWQLNDNGVTFIANGSWMSLWVADGAINDRPISLHSITDSTAPISFTGLLTAPIYGTLNIGSDRAPNYSPAVYYNCGDRVIAVGGGPTAKTFPLRAGDYITTGFTYDDGRNTTGGLSSTGIPPGAGWLWFGTYTGQLYCLDTSLRPVNYTPASIAPANQSYMYTTPTLYKDTQGNVTVFFQARNADANAIPSLYGFSPDNGNVAALPTGATTISALSPTVTHGVLYAAGVIENDATTATQFPQVFAIRVDALVQAERDFIIESQLMQDPQDPGGNGGSTVTAPDGNVIPNSVARYQTHLTVVDDKKHPLANEPIKIWADVAGTVITVDGVQYTVGPDDAAYALVKTGVDGSLVIMSDAKDVNASALRVWAAFMDPFERIMVYPDHEWHGRAAQSNANGTVADPAKPNLNTAYSFKPDPNNAGAPKPLFTSDEKTQGTPANVANGISQMNSGLNPGGNSAASVAGALKTLHGSNPAAPYVAYTTLGGMHYGPNNARAKRTATIAAPFGFALSKPQGGPHTYTPMTHSDARSAIDALTGKPWDPNNPNGTAAPGSAPATFVIRRSDDLFTDFWNWLKGAVAAVENVIVSVADDIMVGINFIVNGVEQAFKAVIKVVEDVVNAIGSFFLQLAKLIEEVIEALCVLFHFGEIIWTHNWLKGLINRQMAGLKDSILNYVKGPFDAFIGSTEDAIKEQFDEWRSQISGQAISDVKGGQSSMHSTFTVKDSSGASSSQSVVAGAHTQKLKGSISPDADNVAATASPQNAHDAITDFVTAFIARITGDGDLKDSFEQLQSDFNNLFKPQSGSQFFATALTTLLDILETLLLGLIAVAGAFIDGMIGVADALISSVQDAMNAPLDIPFFSWLYRLVFKSDLTILDLIALVAAIPATMIFKVVQGNYPSQAGLPDPATMANGSTPATQRAAALSPQAAEAAQDLLSAIRALVGVGNGICIIAQGIMSVVNDGFSDSAPAWLGKASFVDGIIITCLSIPVIYTEPGNVTVFDWSSYGCTAFIAFATGLGLLSKTPTSSNFVSAVLSFQNACCLAFVIFAYIKDKATDTAAIWGFAGNILSVLPGMLNPLKLLLPTAGLVIVLLADVVGNLGWGATTIAAAFAYINTARRQRRLFFPFVSHKPSQTVLSP